MPKPDPATELVPFIDGLGVTTYHEKRSDKPIDDNAEPNLNPNSSFTENVVQGFVFDFAKNWVHHDEESDSYERSAKQEFCGFLHTNRN